MEHDKFMAIIPHISADLVAMISEKQSISELGAIEKLYTSVLYADLEREETKLWHYSTPMLYSLFLQGEETDSIEYPDV